MRTLVPLATIMLVVAGGCGEDAVKDPGGFDEQRSFADLEAQVELGPRPSGSRGSREEVRFIVRRLRDAGVDDVAVQRPHRNVVATVPGRGEGTVVVGAHHDTKDAIPGFVGANDGASGVAVLLELARSLPRGGVGPDLALTFFDAEEPRGARSYEQDGSRGARQFVAYAKRGEQGSPRLGEIRAMVLLDLVGDCELGIPREANSDPGLYSEFSAAAEELDGDPAPFEGTTTPIGDDHLPFAAESIPAVDLIDFAYGPGPPPGAYWHTAEDGLDKVCAESLDAVGEAAVTAIPKIR